MESKERADLLAQANRLQATVQVGKGGVSPALLAQVLDDFRTRELVKIKALLESVPEPPRVLAEKIAQGVGAQVVRVVGGSIVLYKENLALREAAAKKKAASAAKQSRVGIRARKQKAARQGKNVRQEKSFRASAPKQGRSKNQIPGAAGYSKIKSTKYYKSDKK